MRIHLLLFAAGLLWLASSPAHGQAKKQPTDIIEPQKQRTMFNVPEGFEVELIAAEPAVINPISMALDEKGRIYISEGHTYRYGKSGSPVPNPTNPIIRLDKAADGSWKRTIVAEGFVDPVMGLQIRDGKLWCTACDHLYVYDLGDDGVATNRKEIVNDKTKAWNPFGFFVLEWGPEDLMYVSVGNHNIQLAGPTNSLTSRGNSGIVMRMNPDGSNMEKLVEGLRVPYSIEFDPYGQLWLLSNGQGNPDRHVKVIPGVDYLCYSRSKIGNEWLAGKHPLAPPCLEITNGARTQLLHYYGAAFPRSYQGWQLGVNWGPHGTGTRNHALEEFVPDERTRITKTSNWFTCNDPRFRPTQLLLAHDGNLLLADWYGRDDENDLTGRIWKIKYVGKDAPKVTRLADGDWSDAAKVVTALDSLDHLQRERAVRELAKRGNAAVPQVAAHAAQSAEPLGAASALWVLARIGTPEARAAFAEGLKHPEWKVRRLALRQLRRYQVAGTDGLAQAALKDADPAVRLEAALARAKPDDVKAALLQVLSGDVASDPHLRYEAASHLARHGNLAAFEQLLTAQDENLRLAGLITLDIAIYEDTAAAADARQALLQRLNQPASSTDLQLLFDLAAQHPDPAMVPAIQKMLGQPKLKAATIASASKLLRAVAGNKAIANPWLEALKSGRISWADIEDKSVIVGILADEGPTPFGLTLLGKLFDDGNPKLLGPVCAQARQWGHAAAAQAPAVWKHLLNPSLPADARIELAATAASIEAKADVKQWAAVLGKADADLARAIIREFRRYPKDQELLALVNAQRADLTKRDASLAQDLDLTVAVLNVSTSTSTPQIDAKAYREEVLKHFDAKPSAARLALGRAVFDRAACSKCHTLNTENKIGPTLGGVGRHELAHVIESILEPSKIILTGYEVERIETESGKVLSGIVREKGDTLTIISADTTETLPKAKAVDRQIVRVSIMPDGMEKTLSRAEMSDLLSYLMTQKANVGPPPVKKK